MNTTRLITTILGLCLSAGAIAQDTAEDTGIPPQPLNKALEQFADQSGLQIIYVAELAEGKDTPGAKPHLSDTETLDQLLARTGLQYEFLNDNTVTVQAAADDAGGDSDPGNGRTAGATPRAVMMAQAVERSQPSRPNEKESEIEREKRPTEEIIVTGTNIRGIAPESSPSRTYTREDIQISGAGTAQDFIQTLPANFGGGSNDELQFGSPINSNSQFNAGSTGGLGSSVNLRGLGSGSTLVLLNGKRFAPSSGLGDFVDISMIPATALERVDVLTDGASSIYGADAIAGVVNYVLRDDFDDVEASVRYGGVTNGSLDEFRASTTIGKKLSNGNVLASYEYYYRGSLSAGDRDFSSDAPLPSDLLPGQKRHSALLNLRQDLGERAHLYATGMFSSREARSETTQSSGEFLVDNPTNESLNASAGIVFDISNSWTADLSGTHGYTQVKPKQISTVDGIFTRDIDSKISLAELTFSGDLLSLPGGSVKTAIGGQYRSEDFLNTSTASNATLRDANRDVFAVYGELFIPLVGEQNQVPAVERFELNVSARLDDYSDFGDILNPKIGLLYSPFSDLILRGSYGTSFNPPPLGRVGAVDRIANVLPYDLIGSIFSSPVPTELQGSIALSVFGTGTNLDAEDSTAYTAGFDYNTSIANTDAYLSFTYYNIQFENRLGDTPIPDGLNSLLAPNFAISDPTLLPPGTVIFDPAPEEIQSVLDSLRQLAAFEDPLSADIINFAALVRNLANTRVSGMDVNFNLIHQLSHGDLKFGADVSHYLKYDQQSSVTTPVVSQLNTLYNPVSTRYRVQAGYSNDQISFVAFMNHQPRYRVSNEVGAELIDDWTTVDLSLAYRPRPRSSEGLLSGVTVQVSVRNLFDENPPETPSFPQFQIFGYDPANASALNRFISFELRKRF